MMPQEVKLWVQLRSWKSRGYYFRRQAPRDGYILDSVFANASSIELDGGQHNHDAHADRDRKRDKVFSICAFKVLRFWNNEVESEWRIGSD
jgi:very-short-patch-repair endonuclease